MTSRVLQVVVLLGVLRVLLELGWHAIPLTAFAVIFYVYVAPAVASFFYEAFR